MNEIREVEFEKRRTIGTQTDKCLNGEIPEVLLSGVVNDRVEDLSKLQEMVKDEGLSYILDDDSIEMMKTINDVLLSNFERKVEDFSRKEAFHLGDVFNPMQECVRIVVADDFSLCFQPTPYEVWITNIIYFFFYLIGFLLRYLILFPIRLLFLITTTVVALLVISIGLFINNYTNNAILPFLQYFLRFYAEAWCLSIGSVVRVRSPRPPRRPNQIYVCNHTTVLDIAMLLRSDMYSMIGQNNPGFIQILQFILTPMQNVWFQRFEKHDRELVKNKLVTHMGDVTKPPLLVFPEGVCVNNRYTVQFKKGTFELEDVEICPIAIKYNLEWNDAFWFEDSFLHYVLRLMKGWATVVDIHFLKPRRLKKGEKGFEFSHRVKSLISKRIGLKNVNWNGYLRYFTPSGRLLEAQRMTIASRMKRRKVKKEEVEKEEEEKKKIRSHAELFKKRLNVRRASDSNLFKTM